MSDEEMSRRDFFNLSWLKTKGKLVEKVKRKIPKIGIRPPGAIQEEAFLLTCTRCDDCKDACPEDAIFKQSLGKGKQYGETPFLDLKNKACIYCEDFPCITACKVDALVNEPDLLKMGFVVLDKDHCLAAQGQYCDYCANTCPPGINAISIGDDRLPVINKEECVGCGKCEYKCPSQSGKALQVEWLDLKNDEIDQ